MSNDQTDIRELKQENFLLRYLFKKTNKKLEHLSKEKKELETKNLENEYAIKDLTQENTISEELQNRINNKPKSARRTLLLVVLITAISFGGLFVYYSDQDHPATELKTRFIIENLRGDEIDTWLSWNLPPQSTLVVNIVNPELIPREKIDGIIHSITSTNKIEIDSSLLHKGPKGTSLEYFEGWQGVLDSVSELDTQFHLPAKIDVIESKNGEGDVLIVLNKEIDSDGFSGYTKSVADGNQILKSTVTIYDVDGLSQSQIETITRHEFGHVLGLAHSTAPEDLMYPAIKTDYPYISTCDIDALVHLYDGNKSSKIVCQE